MNAVGRQRSGTSTAHHQRQYSDNFLETSSNGRWLQSAGLQHLQTTSNSSIPPPQVSDFFITFFFHFFHFYFCCFSELTVDLACRSDNRVVLFNVFI